MCITLRGAVVLCFHTHTNSLFFTRLVSSYSVAWIAVWTSVFHAKEDFEPNWSAKSWAARSIWWLDPRWGGWGCAGKGPEGVSPAVQVKQTFNYLQKDKRFTIKIHCSSPNLWHLQFLDCCEIKYVFSFLPKIVHLPWLLCTQCRSSQNVGSTGGAASSCTCCWVSQTQKFGFVRKSAQAQTYGSSKKATYKPALIYWQSGKDVVICSHPL